MSENFTDLSVMHVLRPYRRFEYDYDRVGAAAAIRGDVPIAFTWPANPNDVAPPATYDQYAFDLQARNGTDGFSPTLARMVEVPIGASILIYLPVIPSPGFDTQHHIVYGWRVIWRLRNMGDYRREGKPWSIPFQSFGAPDTSSGVAQNRYIIPASAESSVYVRREPPKMQGWSGTIDTPSLYMGGQYKFYDMVCIPAACATNDDSEDIYISSGVYIPSPLQPGHGGLVTPTIADMVDVQQGIQDKARGGGAELAQDPLFVPYWQKAAGNEMAIWCYKFTYQDPADPKSLTPVNWDFDYNPATGYCATTSEDVYFSRAFGVGCDQAGMRGPFDNMGVYVCWGHTGV